MSHTSKDKKQLLTRVRRIKGQASAIESALEKDDADCSSILQQIAAIRGAVNGLMFHVMEGHIREHLGSEDVSARQRQDDLEEVLGVLRSYLK
ncbi:MAG: metal/formaldehyde-sensitive transcriptional repressor [Pseudomonadales bacterium]|nr:metal/formaldehyde-sensitive transcriptional repressor [Halioglobus sp.]MCP5129978.1 metal/formaldehyde-sensitive transcriptional repressor [Pseudomonadales bacterium]